MPKVNAILIYFYKDNKNLLECVGVNTNSEIGYYFVMILNSNIEISFSTLCDQFVFNNKNVIQKKIKTMILIQSLHFELSDTLYTSLCTLNFSSL